MPINESNGKRILRGRSDENTPKEQDQDKLKSKDNINKMKKPAARRSRTASIELIKASLKRKSSEQKKFFELNHLTNLKTALQLLKEEHMKMKSDIQDKKITDQIPYITLADTKIDEEQHSSSKIADDENSTKKVKRVSFSKTVHVVPTVIVSSTPSPVPREIKSALKVKTSPVKTKAALKSMEAIDDLILNNKKKEANDQDKPTLKTKQTKKSKKKNFFQNLRFNKTLKLQSFICDTCDTVYLKNIELQIHLLKHLDDRKPVVPVFRYVLPTHYDTSENPDRYLQKRIREEDNSESTVKLIPTQEEKMESTQEEKMELTQEEKMESTQEEKMESTQEEKMDSTQEEKMESTQEEKMDSTQEEKMESAEEFKKKVDDDQCSISSVETVDLQNNEPIPFIRDLNKTPPLKKRIEVMDTDEVSREVDDDQCSVSSNETVDLQNNEPMGIQLMRDLDKTPPLVRERKEDTDLGQVSSCNNLNKQNDESEKNSIRDLDKTPPLVNKRKQVSDTDEVSSCNDLNIDEDDNSEDLFVNSEEKLKEDKTEASEDLEQNEKGTSNDKDIDVYNNTNKKSDGEEKTKTKSIVEDENMEESSEDTKIELSQNVESQENEKDESIETIQDEIESIEDQTDEDVICEKENKETSNEKKTNSDPVEDEQFNSNNEKDSANKDKEESEKEETASSEKETSKEEFYTPDNSNPEQDELENLSLVMENDGENEDTVSQQGEDDIENVPPEVENVLNQIENDLEELYMKDENGKMSNDELLNILEVGEPTKKRKRAEEDSLDSCKRPRLSPTNNHDDIENSEVANINSKEGGMQHVENLAVI